MNNFAMLLRAGLLALLLAAATPAAASAVDCHANAENLIFGTIDVLAGGIADSSSTLHYGCSAPQGSRVLLCISMEADPRTQLFSPRTLTNPPSAYMKFNLYTDAGRSIVWGSTGSSSGNPPVAIEMIFGANQYYQTGTTPLYGRINSAGQSGLPAGHYASQWPMSISFKALSGGEPIDCSSGSMTKQSSQFYIQAVVQPQCRIDSVVGMDFGTVFMELNQNVDSVATITVTCNGAWGNGYTVMLANGLYPSGSQRRMRGAPGFIRYELYRDPQRTDRWGNEKHYGVSGMGNGLPQSLTVYGRVPPQSPPGAARYSDTIVITLSY
ncbi:spore coat U domain-containing protein [Alcaligenaceae bacterium]|nr:spore coat U domain-containing protein [Alcaligenaceae bacterium]